MCWKGKSDSSAYSCNRFATENSIFHVPEATLGLGLAGGLSYTLPRLLDGNQPLALCLALTGMALEGPDLLFTQIATNYMTHRRLDMMMERLAEVRGLCRYVSLTNGIASFAPLRPLSPGFHRCPTGRTAASCPPPIFTHTD